MCSPAVPCRFTAIHKSFRCCAAPAPARELLKAIQIKTEARQLMLL